MNSPIRRYRVWQRLGAALLIFCVLTTSTGTARASTTPPSAPAVLTLYEAAELLRIGSDELERLARRDEVPARRIGSRWRFNRLALLAWLNGDWKLIVTAVPPRAASLTPRAMGRVSGAGGAILPLAAPGWPDG